MLFTVTYCSGKEDIISHTSNSKMEIYGHYIDFIQRGATLAAMIPGTYILVAMYNSDKKIADTTIQSN